MATLTEALATETDGKADAGESVNEELDLANDLIEAVKAGDQQGVADAFRALFLAMESEPHDEAGED